MKNTFSFRHDYGARNDPKIRKMISRLGPASGWAWWVAVEELYEQGGRLPLDSIPELAYDAHVEESLMKSVICDYGLFKVEKKEFYSSRIVFELKDKEKRSETAQRTANARWEREKARNKDAGENNNASDNLCDGNANAMQMQCNGNAINEMKGNKDKGNEVLDADASSPLGESPDTRPQTKKGKIKSTSQVAELWNRMIDETGAPLRKVARFTEKRKKKVQIRWREFMDVGDPTEVVMRIFQNACTSKFFCGDNKTGWAGDFDWIFENDKNWIKTYEGKYDEHRPIGTQDGRSQLHVTATKPEDFEGNF